jgi:hypothetical protein
MAKNKAASGGFGWLVLGLLVGAAALLTANALLHRRHPAHDQDADASRRISIVPLEAPHAVHHVVHVKAPAPPAESAAAPAAAPSVPKADDDAQMADDAAAAGMTSRTTN